MKFEIARPLSFCRNDPLLSRCTPIASPSRSGGDLPRRAIWKIAWLLHSRIAAGSDLRLGSKG